MTMTMNPRAQRTAPASPSQQLRTRFAAVRVSFTWFGVRKSLSAQQKAPRPPGAGLVELIISPSGACRCIYAEMLNLQTLGQLQIHRASHVEPDAHGRWWVDLSPVIGPTLGPFSHRSEALAAEECWLSVHYLGAACCQATGRRGRCGWRKLEEGTARNVPMRQLV
jgi:hypothetical protein